MDGEKEVDFMVFRMRSMGLVVCFEVCGRKRVIEMEMEMKKEKKEEGLMVFGRRLMGLLVCLGGFVEEESDGGEDERKKEEEIKKRIS